MAQIVVGMADCRTSGTPGEVLATFALGSCIGLIVHDPGSSVGGMLHFMLPDSKIDPVKARENPYTFADTGIPLLLKEVCGRGASRQHLRVHAVGGAQIMDRQGVFEIGKRNYLAMRKILWKVGLLLHGEAVGGNASRTVRLEIGSGKLSLMESGIDRELCPLSPQKGAGTWPTAF
ncbi:MAG TPA: chemotaxis protein CheD [Bryobacteraceae bacterium]|nr:chemotaxis protein CheD [Bryobacteraceae bacterium]